MIDSIAHCYLMSNELNLIGIILVMNTLNKGKLFKTLRMSTLDSISECARDAWSRAKSRIHVQGLLHAPNRINNALKSRHSRLWLYSGTLPVKLPTTTHY